MASSVSENQRELDLWLERNDPEYRSATSRRGVGIAVLTLGVAGGLALIIGGLSSDSPGAFALRIALPPCQARAVREPWAWRARP